MRLGLHGGDLLDCGGCRLCQLLGNSLRVLDHAALSFATVAGEQAKQPNPADQTRDRHAGRERLGSDGIRDRLELVSVFACPPTGVKRRKELGPHAQGIGVLDLGAKLLQFRLIG